MDSHVPISLPGIGWVWVKTGDQVPPQQGLGMVALNERFPKSTILSVVRIVAFCLLLAGTVILSHRAEEVEVPASASKELEGAID